jgi:uncharacterized repeat protein (TIGR03803 family)
MRLSRLSMSMEPSWGKSSYALLFLLVITAIALPAQTFTSLASFNGTNGALPVSMSLVQGTDGNLYGTAPDGGANAGGTVFKVTPAGTVTTLYSFCAQINCDDGKTPLAGLVLGTNGIFYGTTSVGGLNGDGTVFSITSGGALTTLHSFNLPIDGAYLVAALVQAVNGAFYGATGEGGANNLGTIFSMTPGGTVSTLHTFDGTDGQYPYAALIQGTNGTFYGTTSEGGTNDEGTVFSITPGGTLTTVHSFDSTDGSQPYSALVQASNGSLYGTTTEGGTANCSFGQPCGTVFSITTGGTLTTQHSFDVTDGEKPYGALVQATNGSFYGVTEEGGASGYGTIFSLAVGIHPFLETLPTSGGVGAHVKILGTNLTGATSVTFNGTAATFTVVSKSEITTTVPTGATTGTVKVVTPHGTLTSNQKFRL